MKVGAGLIRAVRRYGDTVTTMARPAQSVPAWVSGTAYELILTSSLPCSMGEVRNGSI